MTKTYDKDGIHHVEQVVPEGYTVVATMEPHSCPWDVYGRNWTDRTLELLAKAKLQPVALFHHRTINAPIGSGPGGRVRFGDNMMPGLFRVAVPTAEVTEAFTVLIEHDRTYRIWCRPHAPPELIQT